MRMRNIKLQLWLSDAEAQKLDCNARKAKMTKSAYIRNLISGYEPQQIPPIEYFRVLRELRAIGNNINQIAQRTNVHGGINQEGYQQNHNDLTVIIDELTRAFLPRKRG